MDLDTENRIAAILMKEAAELRRQAEKEGVLAYLQKPTVRGRPNSRFLTATVLGVQQANKAVEVNEMWRLRKKELELDNQLKGRARDESSIRRHHMDSGSSRSSRRRHDIVDEHIGPSCSSSRSFCDSHDSMREEGLNDEEIEEFLHSRVKRGRGAIGSRTDETGPFLQSCEDANEELLSKSDSREKGIVLGPEKPLSLGRSGSSDDEILEDRQKKAKKHHSSSSKHRSSKHRSKEKSRDKKKKKEKRKHKR